MLTPYRRTVLQRTCLLNGQHPPGSALARECPLNPERIAKRSAQARKGAATRRAGRSGPSHGVAREESP